MFYLLYNLIEFWILVLPQLSLAWLQLDSASGVIFTSSLLKSWACKYDLKWLMSHEQLRATLCWFFLPKKISLLSDFHTSRIARQSSRPRVLSPGMFFYFTFISFRLHWWWPPPSHHLATSPGPQPLPSPLQAGAQAGAAAAEAARALACLFIYSFLITNNFYILDLLHVGEPHDTMWQPPPPDPFDMLTTMTSTFTTTIILMCQHAKRWFLDYSNYQGFRSAWMRWCWFPKWFKMEFHEQTRLAEGPSVSCSNAYCLPMMLLFSYHHFQALLPCY